MWEIIDNKGTIHSGDEEEMREAWRIMLGEVTDPPVDIDDEEENSEEEDEDDEEMQITQDEKDKWDCDWDGDIKLVEVHEMYR